MPERHDFYGKNVTRAIENACRELGVRHEQLDVEIITAGSAGIFGFARKQAHIQVTLKEGQDGGVSDPYGVSDIFAESLAAVKGERGQATQEFAGKEKTARSDAFLADTDEEDEGVSSADIALLEKELLEIILLMGFTANVITTVAGRTIEMVLHGDYEEELVGDGGRVLDSLQYLLRKIAGRKLSRAVRLNLDVGNYRTRRLAEMKELAFELAGKVKKDGRTRAIPALSPAERREVHLHLQEEGAIRSRSVGEGMFKKVLIYKPGSNKGRRNFRNRKPSANISKEST